MANITTKKQLIARIEELEAQLDSISEKYSPKMEIIPHARQEGVNNVFITGNVGVPIRMRLGYVSGKLRLSEVVLANSAGLSISAEKVQSRDGTTPFKESMASKVPLKGSTKLTYKHNSTPQEAVEVVDEF